MKNTCWTLNILSIFISIYVFNYIGVIVIMKNYFRDFTDLHKNAMIGVHSIVYILYPIISCIIVYKNCKFGKLTQVQMKCLLLSIFSIICIICDTYCMYMLISSAQNIGIGVVIELLSIIIGHLYLTYIFVYTSCIVSRFREILDLEFVESKNSCSLPNMQLCILLIVILIYVVLLLFGARYA